MSETVTTRAPAGAGRSFDYRWPDPFQLAASANMRARIEGGTSPRAATSSGNGIGTATVEGADVVTLASSLTAGCYLGFPPIHPRTTKSAIALDQFFGAIRLVCTMCGSGTTIAGATDCGFQIVKPLDGTISGLYASTWNGFGYQLIDAATVQLVVRGPNGLVTQNVALDTTKLHTYQFDIVSATPTAEATLAWIIDGTAVPGVSALNTSWAAGSNLPGASTSGFPKYGFLPQLWNNQRIVDTIRAYEVRVIGAPTLLDCQ